MNRPRPHRWLPALLIAAATVPSLAQTGGTANSNAVVAPSGTPSGAPAPVLLDRVVAVVNADAITERELGQRVRAIGQRVRTQGGQLPPEPELRRQVLERMIVERAALQAARDGGIRIDDAAIDRAVGRIAQDAKLSVPQLRQRVESDGVAFASFRAEVASEMAIGRMRERDIDSRVQVSEAEIDAYLAEQADGGGAPPEFNIAQLVVTVPENAAPDAVERARERVEALARDARGGADLARLASGPQGGEGVTSAVIGMRAADRLPALFVQAVESLQPGEIAPVVRSPVGFHLLRLLDKRAGGGLAKLAATPVRQTRARHILVRVNELNPENEVVRRLTEIRQRIEGGAVQFADMARQYSVDGSASQGGDLGWVYPGDTVPEFERAMDTLEPGRIAGPVQTPFGYHLIQVEERRTDGASPERVRAAARNAIRERKAAEAYQEWIAQVRDRAYVDVRLDER